MARQSLEQIIDYITAWGNAHEIIKKVGSDFASEMGIILTEDERYPALFIALDPGANFGLNTNTVDLEIYCFDIIQKGRENITHIISDTERILNDLFLELSDGDNWDIETELLGDIERIDNAQLDYLAGNKMLVRVTVESYSVCEIPIGDFIDPTPPTECEDGTVNVNKSDGSLIQAVGVSSGGVEPYNVADSTAVLKDSAGTVLSTTLIKATESEDIPAPDAHIVIKKENDGTIAALELLSGSNGDYTVSDNEITVNGGNDFTIHATDPLDVRLRDGNNNIVEPISVTKTGNQATIVLPGVADWVRPSWWPERPELEEGVYYLVELFEDTEQYLFWNSGSDTDIYLDGVLVASHSAGVGEYFTITNSYGFTFGGRKFTWIYFDIDGVSPYISLVNNDFATNPHSIRALNILEILVNKDLNYFYQTDGGFSYGIKMFTRNMWFKQGISILNTQGLFINTNLENIENFPTLRGGISECFRDCNMSATPEVLDFTNVTSATYAFYANTKRTATRIQIINSGNLTSIFAAFQFFSLLYSLEFDDLSGVSSALYSFQSCQGLQRIILNDLAVSFNIDYCYSLSKQAILDMIDSLADLTSLTSQDISMISTPFNTDTDVVNAATAKNWNILT